MRMAFMRIGSLKRGNLHGNTVFMERREGSFSTRQASLHVGEIYEHSCFVSSYC